MDKITYILSPEMKNKLNVDNCYTDPIRAIQTIKKHHPKILVIDLDGFKFPMLNLIYLIRKTSLLYHTKIIVMMDKLNLRVLKNAFLLGADFFASLDTLPIIISTIYNIDEVMKQTFRLN